ncbi:alpha/beta fold hydrolase [Nocardioides panaciterrulae]|uniref:Alpha-beta hydrolase superfamily lysophospholipase n=1 Tax=Nocardioides panaciterrulae TaxID=661492 RepID=A0A7Y9E5B6_9ACTN|nr:alpha/beta hydrolase [Nocardioides panaciterrulae]NYD41262.1 alpha-beta hydrolase superfamily lysophospholipase [Nocardioides panaciterrulae]
MRRPTRSTLPALTAATALVAGALTVLSPAAATASPRTGVISRPVRIAVENTNATAAACVPDDGSYTLHARLVGPRREVLGSNLPRVNVLVHDLATGSWFWNLRRHPAYDYAGRLAAHGETSLVLDRLGYGASRLPDGDATCLGAQADMLHQVVQHLRSGHYRFAGSRAATPAAQHVVLQGHSVGAAIAELEAGTFDDVDGLVLMSWTDDGASQRAVDEATRQSSVCVRGDDYVRAGRSPRDYRRLLFVTAPAGVQRSALAHRGAEPCGDPLSLGPVLAASALTTREVEAPVLLLFGSRDALTRHGAPRRQRFSSSASVTSHVVRGAGSALPLERSAGRTRALVRHWLAGLPG